mgnify:CR=1 FL=1
MRDWWSGSRHLPSDMYLDWKMQGQVGREELFMNYFKDMETVFEWQKAGMEALNSFFKGGYDQAHKAQQLWWDQGLLWMKRFQKMHADWMDLFQKEIDNVHTCFQKNLGTMEQYLTSTSQSTSKKAASGTQGRQAKSK